MRHLLWIASVLPAFAAGPSCTISGIPATINARTAYPGSTFRSGSIATLSQSCSSGDSSTLLYSWSQESNLATGITSAIANGLPSTSASPTINVHVPPGQTGPAPLDIALTVKDSGDQLTATYHISYGVVPMTDSGVAILPTGAVSTILQQPMANGKDPWPWRDTAAADVAALYAGTYDLSQSGTPNYYTVISGGWNTASTHGVISSISSYAAGLCPNGAFTSGCFVLHGSGSTQFDTDFCGGPGGTSFSLNPVIWYLTGRTNPDTTPETGRMWFQYGACSGAHTIYGNPGGSVENQSYFGWPGDATGWTGVTSAVLPLASQLNLSYSSTSEGGGCTSSPGACWWSGGQPPYYDPGMMFYGLWYRAGIDIYLWNARQWEDTYWNGPVVDHGIAIALGNGPACLIQVNCYGLNSGGLILRALDTSDGHLDMWAGLEHIFFWNADWIANYTWAQHSDPRISGAALMAVSYAALYDPGASNYATTWCPNCSSKFPGVGTISWPQFHRTAIHSSLANFTGGRDSIEHGWLTLTWQMSSYDGGQPWSGALASLTNGSTAVTCTGCNLTSAMFTTKIDVANNGSCVSGPTCVYPAFTFANNSGSAYDSANWDNQSYCTGGCTYVDANHFTLDRTYAGTTATHNWASALNQSGSAIFNYVTISGLGQDSFMQGVLGGGFQVASQACTGTPTGCSSGDDTTYAGYAQDAANWIVNWSIAPAYYAMSYFGGYPVCINGASPPLSITALQCLTSTNSITLREYMGDSITGMIRAFSVSPNATMRSLMDNWYAGMWAKPGTNPLIASPDGNYDSSFDSSGCSFSATWPYYTGSCGFWIYSANGSPLGSQKAIAQHFGISIQDTWPAVRLNGVAAHSNPSGVF